MSDQPFIKFYPSDFLGGTSGLSPAERGVYITLLCLIYEMDGAIERDDGRLSRRCGMPKASFTRILSALIDEGKITESGGKLSNNRAEKAIVDRQIRSQNATHAVNSRWAAQKKKTEQKQEPDDTHEIPAQYVSDTSQSQSQNRVYIGRFQEFWDAYPHRGSKKKRKDCEKKYRAAVARGVTEEAIILGVKKMRFDPEVQRGYGRDPLSWLNQEGWTDEISPTSQDAEPKRNRWRKLAGER